jgi:hypothetical protein
MPLGAAALSSPSNTAECLVSLFTAIDTRMLNHHFGVERFRAAPVPFSDFSSDPLSSDFPDGGDMLTCNSGGDLPRGELGRRSGAFACPRHHVPCLLAMSSGR